MILQMRELGLFLNSSKKIILDGRGDPSFLSSGLQIRVKSACFYIPPKPSQFCPPVFATFY